MSAAHRDRFPSRSGPIVIVTWLGDLRLLGVLAACLAYDELYLKKKIKCSIYSGKLFLTREKYVDVC